MDADLFGNLFNIIHKKSQISPGVTETPAAQP